MSISNAFNNAASGLKVTSKLASTISNNVSNALTAGYAARTTELSSVTVGGAGSGVRVAGTTRAESPYLTAERRLADAAEGATATRSDAYTRLIDAMGEAGVDGSLSANATALETALMAATASPQSTALLTDAVDAARDVVTSLNNTSVEAAKVRSEADAAIGRQVDAVNETLHKIEALNGRITNLNLQGIDTLSLQDERAMLVDDLSSIIPVKTANRDGGQIAVFAQNGGALLDGKVWELKFDPAPNGVTSDMTLANGALSGLSQNQGGVATDVALTAGTGRGPLDGGSLGALFEVRDTLVPGFTGELDLYAADLKARFQDLMPAEALDGAGEGLFIDAGAAGTEGLAARITLNAAVDPDKGGAVWRLRDGMGTATSGVEGDGATLQLLSDAMAAERAPTGFISQTANNGSATMASELSAYFVGRSVRSDDDLAFLSARAATLREQEVNANGVDSDSELQYLTLVEQAYAANAKVLTTIDDLMQALLEI